MVKRKNTKKKRRYSKNKKNMKGGFFRKMNREYVQYWESIHRKPMDCCPCVFNLLELDTDESLKLIDKFGFIGMKNNQLIEILQEKYPEYSFSLKQNKTLKPKIEDIIKLKDLEVSIQEKKALYSKHRIDYSEEVNDFLKVIPENHGVIGIIRGPGFNHCVVFAKMNGRLVYYDAQLKKSIIGKEKIGRHLIEKIIYQIDYIQGIQTAKTSLTGPWNDLYSKGEWGSKNPNNLETRTKYKPSIFTDYTTDGQ